MLGALQLGYQAAMGEVASREMGLLVRAGTRGSLQAVQDYLKRVGSPGGE